MCIALRKIKMEINALNFMPLLLKQQQYKIYKTGHMTEGRLEKFCLCYYTRLRKKHKKAKVIGGRKHPYLDL